MKKVIFMGTPEFAIPILQMLLTNYEVVLVVTQPDKLVGRKQVLTYSPIKTAALKQEIEVYQPENIKKEYEKIINTKADIIITCAYGQIIPKIILDYPEYGCINVHASLLPKFRGGAPIHKALIDGEKKTGVTIMYMDELMDTGDIIAQQEYTILAHENVGDLHVKLSKIGADLLKDTLPTIFAKTNARIKQNNALATYACTIKRNDERIDFNQNGKKIIDQIRGLNPWPLANFILEDQEVKVYAAFLEKKEKPTANTISKIDKFTFGIDCLDGTIYLEKIKPFGKKAMMIKEYLNGVNKEELKKKKINK